MHRCAETSRQDLCDAAGIALARALDAASVEANDDRQPEWLELFCEGAAMSADTRLPQRVAELVDVLRQKWPAEDRTDALARSLDACLRAADLFASEQARSLVQDGIDALERMIAIVYA